MKSKETSKVNFTFYPYIYLISCLGSFSFIVLRTFWFEAATIRSIFEVCLTLCRWSNKFLSEGDYTFCGPSPYQRALLSAHSPQFFFSFHPKTFDFLPAAYTRKKKGYTYSIFTALLLQILDDRSRHLTICCENIV